MGKKPIYKLDVFLDPFYIFYLKKNNTTYLEQRWFDWLRLWITELGFEPQHYQAATVRPLDKALNPTGSAYHHHPNIEVEKKED